MTDEKTYAQEDRVTLTEAVRLIAAAAYPDEPKRTARNRVRTAIYDCRKSGVLTSYSEELGGSYSAEELFRWAKTRWASLGKHPQLPDNESTGEAKGTLPAIQGRAEGFTLPANRDLWPKILAGWYAQLMDCRREVQSLREINGSLQAEVKDLEEQLAKCKGGKALGGRNSRGVPKSY